MPASEPNELPEDLADLAAERLLGLQGSALAVALEALVAEHPDHEAALRRLQVELAGAARLLAAPRARQEVAAALPHLGGYRVMRCLGEGAFGVVYLCAQQRPVVRDVAIKVLRGGMGDANTLRRFGAERQVLASLNHPCITHVFDAGELPDGRPFFVMEYIDGTTMRRYCEDRQLPCRERLTLFAQLCRGVAHAHARGIVHRDLKPGNVLVVDTDAGPMPKIIDFGIAKALFASDADAGPRTDAGRVIGTPGYMSPEQASGRVDEIDGRADVFALGVMLYELLTWQMPWQMGAAATDTDPVRPSAKITTSTSSGPTVAPSLRRQRVAELRGDLDWITMKALARERDDRYASPVALADDIERHLRGEPVTVGPPSTIYRLRKFVRRNRSLVSALGAAAIIVTAGLWIALSYGKASKVQVDDAHAAAAASFVDDVSLAERLLASANDERLRDAPQGDVARQSLLEAAHQLFDRLLRAAPNAPNVIAGRCRALIAISHVYRRLGDTVRASTAADAAHQSAERLFAATQQLVHRGLLAAALHEQGAVLSLSQDNAQAAPKLAAAVGHFEACAAQSPPGYVRLLVQALRNYSEVDPVSESRLAKLLACRATIQTLRQQHGALPELTEDDIRCCLGISLAHQDQRQLGAADEALQVAASQVQQLTSGRCHITYDILHRQSMIAAEKRNWPASIERGQAAAGAALEWQKEQPQSLIAQEASVHALTRLASSQSYGGQFEESSTSFRQAIAFADKLVERFPGYPRPTALLARTLLEAAHVLWDRSRQADLTDAAAYVARLMAIDRELLPPGAPPPWRMLAMQASIADARGDAAAERFWQPVEVALTEPVQVSLTLEDFLIEAFTGLGRMHFLAGRDEAATTWMSRAEQHIDATRPHYTKRFVEVGWLQARIAAKRGDHLRIAALADRIKVERDTWFGLRRSADCLHLAARVARATDSAAADDYSRRAIDLYDIVIETLKQDVANDPMDPWYVLPWACSVIRKADLVAVKGDQTKARSLLQDALPKLEAVRSATLCDLWEEDVVQDGKALLANIEAPASNR